MTCYSTDAEVHDAPSLLTDATQVAALALHISRAFPPWRIWRAGVWWYATNPCRIPECPCSRTLHAPDLVALCRQLDEVEQVGRRQRENRPLTIAAAFLRREGPFADEADKVADRQLAALQQDYPDWNITCVADLTNPIWHAELRTLLTQQQKDAGRCEMLTCFSAEALGGLLSMQVQRVHQSRPVDSSARGRRCVASRGRSCR